jgi:hypothetical protein
MKTYYNSTTEEWYYEGHSITRPVEGGFFSGYPTEEQLLEWGFEEYIAPAPTPEELLEQTRKQKLYELQDYDSSPAVNSFNLFGEDMWIAPDERSNYMLTLEGAKRLGISEITFLGHNVPLDDALNMLDAINVYAMQCVGVTDAHRKAINELTTIEDVEAYDFTVGYPEKLVFGNEE